jgi:hypothetical protein
MTRVPELTLNDYVSELRLDANHLEGIVDEIEQCIVAGDLDGAALVLSSQTGKIGRFTEAYGALQKRLRDEGADPERAISLD